jgi:hypothetical protein
MATSRDLTTKPRATWGPPLPFIRNLSLMSLWLQKWPGSTSKIGLNLRIRIFFCQGQKGLNRFVYFWTKMAIGVSREKKC